MIGKTISHYKILEKLGGGMGVVYKAQDLKLDRFVALKFLPHHLSADEDEKKRFVHEAKAASALDHPNICTIYEIDETEDGRLFIVMAYYEGETLKKKVASSQLPVNSVIDIAIQIAQGLAKAHEHGIVHRDIKPANVMITKDGVVKILDFGVAKLAGQTRHTKTGATVGTVAYMSPEQTRGAEVDHRTDIWALGVVLYEMITGQLPFKGEYEQAVMYSIMNEAPEPITALRPEVPVTLEQVVAKAMAKDPEERYPHSEEMRRDLESIQNELKPRTTQARVREMPRSFFYTSAAVLLVVILIGGLFLWQRAEKRKNNVEMQGGKGVSEEAVAFARNRVAVLPLANLSPAVEDEYFADGLTEEFISMLSKVGGLRVIARTSIMPYKEKSKSAAEIGRELKVGKILEGSVRKAQDRLRLTVRLIDVGTQDLLWSQVYNREIKDIFDIQSDIASQVAHALQVQFMEGESPGFGMAFTKNSEAYALYLKGRYFWNKRTEAGFKKAIEYFEQALEKDPKYAVAHSGIADCYNLLSRYGILSPREGSLKAKASALRALELDTTLVEAHASLAFVKLFYDWEWLGAEQELERAIKLNPSYPSAHHWYSHYFMATGRFEASLAESKLALECDPIDLALNTHLGYHYYYARQYIQATDQLQKTLEMEPSFARAHYYLGLVYVQLGRSDKSFIEFQKTTNFSRGQISYKASLGHAYAIFGKRDEALAILDELRKLSEPSYVAAFDIALLYLGLGDKDQAFEWLQRSYLEHEVGILVLKVEPRLDGIRSDPRFTDLLKKVGLEK